MKAATLTKLNNLLNIGRPSRDHDDRAHHDMVQYISPDRVVGVTMMYKASGDDKVSFDGSEQTDRDLTVKINTYTRGLPMSRFNRKYLLDALSNMDCEIVTLHMAKDTPVMIEGTTEDSLVCVCIAPYITPEDQ